MQNLGFNLDKLIPLLIISDPVPRFKLKLGKGGWFQKSGCCEHVRNVEDSKHWPTQIPILIYLYLCKKGLRIGLQERQKNISIGKVDRCTRDNAGLILFLRRQNWIWCIFPPIKIFLKIWFLTKKVFTFDFAAFYNFVTRNIPPPLPPKPPFNLVLSSHIQTSKSWPAGDMKNNVKKVTTVHHEAFCKR